MTCCHTALQPRPQEVKVTMLPLQSTASSTQHWSFLKAFFQGIPILFTRPFKVKRAFPNSSLYFPLTWPLKGNSCLKKASFHVLKAHLRNSYPFSKGNYREHIGVRQILRFCLPFSKHHLRGLVRCSANFRIFEICLSAISGVLSFVLFACFIFV